MNKFFFLSTIIILTTFSKITNSQSFNGEYDEKLNAFISDFQVNEDFGSGLQNHSAIAIDDSDNFIIVWDERRNGVTTDIYAQRFLKEGVPIGKEIKVNNSNIYSDKYFPEIKMNVNGNFIIAWGDRSESKNDVYFQRFSKNGNRIDDNIKVNDFEGQYPRLAIDGSGNFLILWQDIRNTFYFPTLYAQFYSKDGFRLGNNFRINDENKVPQGRQNLSVNTNGDYIVTWLTEPSIGVYAQKISSVGNLVGNNFKVSGTESIPSSSDGVAVAENGGFIITWTDNKRDYSNPDIYAQRFSKNNTEIGNEFKVNSISNIYGSRSPTISINNKGRFTIVWQSKDNKNKGWDIYAQMYDEDGSKIEENIKINKNPTNIIELFPAVSLNDLGEFVVSWTSFNENKEILAQIYSSEDGPLGENFKANQKPNLNFQSSPKIKADKNGNFVIVWFDDRTNNAYVKRFNSSGLQDGYISQVNDDSIHVSGIVDLAMDNFGNYVVAWQGYQNNFSDVYFQLFSSDGKRKGSNIKVNEGYIGQYYRPMPVVDFFPDGRFIIVWKDARVWANEAYGQLYEQDGSRINNNFRISYSEIVNRPDVTVKGILNPALSINNNGDFAVVWSDMKSAFRFDYDYANIDIYGQLFSKDCTPIGENIQLVGAGSSNRYNPAIVLKDSVLIMSWSNQTNQLLYMQRFLFDGTPLGEQSQVFDNDTTVFSFLSKPSIAMDKDGNFIVVWDGRQNDIYGQRFTQEGIAVGGNFRITNTSNDYQGYPDVFLSNNRIYNTWVDNHSGESGFDIWANVLSWDSPVSIEDIENNKPNSFYLYQNYPNPFNPTTKIKYSIPKAASSFSSSNVTLKVYDILGREVAALVNEQQKPGNYEVEFNAAKLSSGIYFYSIKVNEFYSVRKMTLLK